MANPEVLISESWEQRLEKNPDLMHAADHDRVAEVKKEIQDKARERSDAGFSPVGPYLINGEVSDYVLSLARTELENVRKHYDRLIRSLAEFEVAIEDARSSICRDRELMSSLEEFLAAAKGEKA